MAITNISISQDNKVGESNLMAVQSPLVFLIDVTYTGDPPDVLYCDLQDEDSVLLNTFKCIPYKDLLSNVRQFMFIADSVMRGYMDSFDDFVQSENSLAYVDGMTKVFNLTFRDPDAVAESDSINVTAIHAAKQFGNNPNLSEISNNDTDSYLTAKGNICYVYFYNNSAGNIVSLLPSEFSTFIISDIDGFIEGAKISIGDQDIYSDSYGEANVQLANGTYNYTVYKLGYAEYNGAVTINNDFFNIPITLTELVLGDVNIILTGGETALVKIYNVGDNWWLSSTDPIETVQVTDGLGVASNLYAPFEYTFIISPSYCDLKQALNEDKLTSVGSVSFTLENSVSESFDIIVKDADTLLPIEGAVLDVYLFTIWNGNGNASTNMPECFVPFPDTDVNGESTMNWMNPTPDTSWDMTLRCYADGYNNYGKYVHESDNPLTILMQKTS